MIAIRAGLLKCISMMRQYIILSSCKGDRCTSRATQILMQSCISNAQRPLLKKPSNKSWDAHSVESFQKPEPTEQWSNLAQHRIHCRPQGLKMLPIRIENSWLISFQRFPTPGTKQEAPFMNSSTSHSYYAKSGRHQAMLEHFALISLFFHVPPSSLPRKPLPVQ